MTRWIALLRGINVGGNNPLPMAELRRDLEFLTLKNVCTYIHSGNVIFDSGAKTASSLAKKIGRRIQEQHGFRPHVLILSQYDLLAAVDSNPFPEAVADPKTLHFIFLSDLATNPDLKALEKLRTSSERFGMAGRVFYLHAPDGIARSKLAANIEKRLGVSATARNYRTVDKLLSMAMQR